MIVLIVNHFVYKAFLPAISESAIQGFTSLDQSPFLTSTNFGNPTEKLYDCYDGVGQAKCKDVSRNFDVATVIVPKFRLEVD